MPIVKTPIYYCCTANFGEHDFDCPNNPNYVEPLPPDPNCPHCGGTGEADSGGNDSGWLLIRCQCTYPPNKANPDGEIEPVQMREVNLDELWGDE